MSFSRRSHTRAPTRGQCAVWRTLWKCASLSSHRFQWQNSDLSSWAHHPSLCGMLTGDQFDYDCNNTKGAGSSWSEYRVQQHKSIACACQHNNKRRVVRVSLPRQPSPTKKHPHVSLPRDCSRSVHNVVLWLSRHITSEHIAWCTVMI